MTARVILSYTAKESVLACGLNFVFGGNFDHVWRDAFWL
jgi:hypothetical protein